MKNFVFEWLSEELPFKVQNHIQGEVTNLFKHELQKADVLYDTLSVYTTPRRFSVLISNIKYGKILSEIKGPKADSSENIIEQFLKRVSKNRNELYVKKISGKEYYFVKEDKNIDLSKILKSTVETILPKINWPKTMRWGDYSIKCNRPIVSLLALLNEEVVPVEFFHYKASNKTLGHRFLLKEEIIISRADKYEQLLMKGFVILNQDKRKNTIKSLSAEVIKDQKYNNIEIGIDEELLDEVNALVEYPIAIIGSIPKQFIDDLPEELITVVMKNHQRFFSCFYKNVPEECLINNTVNPETLDNSCAEEVVELPQKIEFDNSAKMAPYFLAVSNVPNNPNILKGYEKVLKARLSDAISLVEVDKKQSIEVLSSKLKDIIFHAKLGNIEQKVARMSTLAKYIAVWVNGASIVQVEKAVSLSKIDLSTQAIGEFPELAGAMSAYYYTLSGGEVEIANALKQHTYPINASSKCTNNPISATIAIADKIDSLVGFIIAGENIDSTKDPFGIRRNAIGVIRTIFENNINLPLKLIIEKSVSLFPQKLFKSKIMYKIKDEENIKLSRVEVSNKVLEYCLDRIYAILKNESIKLDILKDITFNYHPLDLKNNANFLKEFLSTEDGIFLIATYRRMSNILGKADITVGTTIKKKLLQNPEEYELVEHLASIEREVLKLSKKNNIIGVISHLNGITQYLENFMNNVVVNDADESKKLNRLNILNKVKSLCNKAIDFEMIIKNN